MIRRSALHMTAHLLLAVMAVQLVQVASFELRRMVLRSEMKEQIRLGLPQDKLVHFTFSPSAYEALEKEDGGREFWVDGHIHDVVRSFTVPDGTVHIEAVEDRDEARLMAGLNELLQNGMARKGMDRERARTVVAALACSLPIRPLSLLPPAAVIATRFPGHGDLELERAPRAPFHPPRT